MLQEGHAGRTRQKHGRADRSGTEGSASCKEPWGEPNPRPPDKSPKQKSPGRQAAASGFRGRGGIDTPSAPRWRLPADARSSAPAPVQSLPPVGHLPLQSVHVLPADLKTQQTGASFLQSVPELCSYCQSVCSGRPRHQSPAHKDTPPPQQGSVPVSPPQDRHHARPQHAS